MQMGKASEASKLYSLQPECHDINGGTCVQGLVLRVVS